MLFELLKACWGFSEEPVVYNDKFCGLLSVLRMLWFSLMQFFSSAKEYYILSIDLHWLRLQHAIPPVSSPRNWLTNVSRGRGGQEFYNRDCYRGGEFDTTWEGWVMKQLYYFHISYTPNLRGRVIWWTPISLGRAFAHNFRTWEMGGGACWSSIWPVHYETVNEKLWMKRNRCQSISTFRPTGKWRPLYRLQKHVRCNSQRHSWESLSST